MFGGFNTSYKLGQKGISCPASTTTPDQTGETIVEWTDDTYFNFYTTSTSLTTDSSLSQSATQNRMYQLCYAHQALTIPNDATNRLAVGTYSTQVTAAKRWWIAISTSTNFLRMPTTFTGISSDADTTPSSAGAFVEQPCRSAVTIPANRYFLIGHSIIAMKALRTLTAPRTMSISGTPYLTTWPTIYYFSSQSETRVPLEFGGFGRLNTIFTNTTHVMSVKFKL